MTPKTRHEYLPNFFIDSSLLSLILRFPHERCRDRFRSKTNKHQPPSTASSKGGLASSTRTKFASKPSMSRTPGWPVSLGTLYLKGSKIVLVIVLVLVIESLLKRKRRS